MTSDNPTKTMERACPLCAAPPVCFTMQLHEPMESCPICDEWAKELDEPHAECVDSAMQYTTEGSRD